MKISYEGIGQWAATFACSDVAAGEVVQISGNAEVAGCGSGNGFCGVVLTVSRDGEACAVAMGGMQTVAYTGEVPGLGWCALSADGEGGVQVDEGGRNYQVVAVDETAKTVTFVL